MNWADWTIVAILLISSLIGLRRGLVKEALSLLVWVAAFIVAIAFHPPLTSLLTDIIDVPSVRTMVAFGGLFVATLIVGSMVNYLIGELVKMTGLTGTDRLLGVIFGAARGTAVVMALLLLIPALIPIEQDLWWQQSVLIPQFLRMEGLVLQLWYDLYNWFAALFG